MSSRFWTMYQFTAPFRGGPAAAGVGHDTPVSDQVSDNGTEHSGISVPGPGRLATGKIIKRPPSEVLRDEAVINRTAGDPGHKRATTTGQQGSTTATLDRRFTRLRTFVDSPGLTPKQVLWGCCSGPHPGPTTGIVTVNK